jgi:hypothetical protein
MKTFLCSFPRQNHAKQLREDEEGKNFDNDNDDAVFEEILLKSRPQKTKSSSTTVSLFMT